jgi:hypothetical protein
MDDSSLSTRFRSLFMPLGELSARRELLSFLLILAETMIIFVLAGTILAEYEAPYVPLSIVIIFSILLVAHAIPHVLTTIRVWTPEYEIVMGVSLVVTMLLAIKIGAFPHASLLSLDWMEGTLQALILRESEAIRPVWMLIAFVVYAWWRGRTRAEATLETAYTMLRFGLIWLAAALLFTMAAAPDNARIFDYVIPALLGFIVFTLLAVAIARQPEGENTAAWSTSWIWIIVLTTPVLAIALTSISTIGVLNREVLDLIVVAVTPVFWLLQMILQAMVLAIAVLAFVLISPLLWLLDRYGFNPIANFPTIDLSPGAISEAERYASSTFQIENPLRYLIAGLILLGLTWLLIRFTYKRRRRWQEPARQQWESLIDWGPEDETLLHRASRWITSRLNRQTYDPHESDPKWRANRRIRLTYRSFLRLARRQGFVRAAHDTPNQFAQTLASNFTDLSQPTERITVRYNEARYSGQVLDDVIADEAEDAFLDVRAHFPKYREPVEQ